jgi:hypothetical protein
MAAPTCLFYNATNSAYLDINNGTTYRILRSDMGAKVKTWDEYRAPSGRVAQYNVTTANLIDVTIVLRVQAASAAALRTALTALNTRIDDIVAGTTHLVFDGTTYHLMSSPPLTWEEDARFHAGFWTDVVLELKRNTETA